MRIAIVNQPWARSHPPGESVAIWSAEVASRLVHKHDVGIYGHGSRLARNTDHHDGVRYEYVPRGADHRLRRGVEPALNRVLSPRRPFFASRFFYPTYWHYTAKALHDAPPDVVHVHMFPRFVERVRREFPHTTTALHLHWGWLTQLDRRVVDRQLEAADLVLSCSNALTEAVRDAYPRHAERCHTIYNGVDVARFEAPPGEAPPHHDVRLLFVGRVAPDKGIHVLLEAFERLIARGRRVRLDILGASAALPREMALALNDDPAIRTLESFYAQPDVAANYMRHLRGMLSSEAAARVSFLGPAAHADVPPHMHKADIFVNASIEEAFGMPVVEAMATGLPVVASRVGGLPEVVDDEVTGLLVKPTDSQELLEALERLVANPDLRVRMGAAGRRRAHRLFSWERVARRAERLYEEA